ncbi:hypothetical protein [Streptomyces virginiae]|uniref:hypothetical protein n=1 Tax=Streptomyces virginiae TaxID=1961 RepID=UPI003422C6A6
MRDHNLARAVSIVLFGLLLRPAPAFGLLGGKSSPPLAEADTEEDGSDVRAAFLGYERGAERYRRTATG